jgi:hypothetical protein
LTIPFVAPAVKLEFFSSHKEPHMSRFVCWLLVGTIWSFAIHQQLAAQQPAPRPAAPAATQAEPTDVVPATKEETWTLGGQQWDFKDVATAYKPTKGALDPRTGVAVWTLELVKELSAGEIGLQENLEGSPFKPVFIDEEKIAVQGDATVRITKITGRPGDKIKLTMQLPPAEILDAVKVVRIERRTKVGF